MLVLAPVLVYFKSIFYGFSPMDEQWLIVNDTAFLSKWGNLGQAFSDSIQHIYYRPLLMWSFILNYQAAHLAPWLYHATNLLFHVCAVILLYRLLVKTGAGSLGAFVPALLFSLHPVLAHAVAWIPGRNDSLLAIFMLSALIYLVAYVHERKPYQAALHLLFFFCALLCKESAVMLPFIFTALFFVYQRPGRLFFIGLACWLALIAAWFLLRGNAVHYSPANSAGFLTNGKQFILSLLIFIGKTIIPVQLSVTPTLSNTNLWPGLLNLFLLIFICVKPGLKNKKIAAAGLFMYLLLLAMPVWFGVLSPLGEQYEHRAYTAMTGLALFAGQLRVNLDSKRARLLVAGIALAYASVTFVRINVYRDELSYLDEGIAHCPDNYMFYSQKSELLYSRHNLNGALAAMNEAIRLQPGRSKLFHNRSCIYAELNKKQQAIADINSAIALSEKDAKLYLTRCETYHRFGETDKAMQDLKMLKECCAAHIPRGLERQITLRWIEQHLNACTQQIAAEPGNAKLYVRRAELLFSKKQYAAALADVKKACELEPSNTKFQTLYYQVSTAIPH